jgi:hypothetical protein
MSESEENSESDNENEFISQSQTNLLSIRYRLERLYQRHLEECEDLIVPETNNNPNFMHEKDMKFNLYPFYINWKQIETSENNFYDIFVHYGYFGASLYSAFKDTYPDATNKDIIYLFSYFCYDFLVKENEDQENSDKEIIAFIAKLPEIKKIYKLIQKKIIMFKEIPIYLIVLKIYEIYYLYKNYEVKMIDLLKNQYLLMTYLTDEEYQEIFKNHFKGKVSSIFKKLVDVIGNQVELPTTKNKYINHIKFIYQFINKNNKKENIVEEKE